MPEAARWQPVTACPQPAGMRGAGTATAEPGASDTSGRDGQRSGRRAAPTPHATVGDTAPASLHLKGFWFGHKHIISGTKL